MSENKKVLIKTRRCKDCPQCSSDSNSPCFWKIEKHMPEKFRPSKIKSYISIESINGIGYLKAVEMDGSFDSEFISWFFCFCVGKKINAFWKTNGVPFCIGDSQFIELALRASESNMI